MRTAEFSGVYDHLTSVARLSFSPLSHIRRSMLVVHVHVHVKPECVEAFKQATLANARESLKEPGVARFDVVQQQDDPTRFVLVEVYRDADCRRRAQGNEALSGLAGRGRADDGRAAFQREVQQRFPDDKDW